MNVGQFDQALAAFGDLAKALHAYMKHLIAEGFTREEAIRLVIQMQENMIAKKKE